MSRVTLQGILAVIRSFAHRGLERFFRTGDKSGIQPAQEGRLRLILGALNAAVKPQDMALPGLRLHRLSGKRLAQWSVSVSGNWRVVFEFEGTDAVRVNYLDYH